MLYVIAALLVVFIFVLLLVVGAIGNAVKQLESIDKNLGRLSDRSIRWLN